MLSIRNWQSSYASKGLSVHFLMTSYFPSRFVFLFTEPHPQPVPIWELIYMQDPCHFILSRRVMHECRIQSHHTPQCLEAASLAHSRMPTKTQLLFSSEGVFLSRGWQTIQTPVCINKRFTGTCLYSFVEYLQLSWHCNVRAALLSQCTHGSQILKEDTLCNVHQQE